jgi:DNA-directed RNA polymerase specialized sigma24 family protein
MQPELVLRARNGDHEAFALLANAAFDPLFRTARLILRDEDSALDAVQDALLSAWLHVRAVRDPDRFEAWLRRLLTHACYRQARRTGRRRVMEIHVTPLDWSPSGDQLLFQDTSDRNRPSLWTVRPDGSDVRLLVDGGAGGAWQWIPANP